MKAVMKVKAAHFYQYVRFQNKNENFVTKKPGMEDVELTLLEGNILEIKSGKDHILVFNTNIAYLIPEDEGNKGKKLENRGNIDSAVPSTPRKA